MDMDDKAEKFASDLQDELNKFEERQVWKNFQFAKRGSVKKLKLSSISFASPSVSRFLKERQDSQKETRDIVFNS